MGQEIGVSGEIPWADVPINLLIKAIPTPVVQDNKKPMTKNTWYKCPGGLRGDNCVLH